MCPLCGLQLRTYHSFKLLSLLLHIEQVRLTLVRFKAWSRPRSNGLVRITIYRLFKLRTVQLHGLKSNRWFVSDLHPDSRNQFLQMFLFGDSPNSFNTFHCDLCHVLGCHYMSCTLFSYYCIKCFKNIWNQANLNISRKIIDCLYLRSFYYRRSWWVRIQGSREGRQDIHFCTDLYTKVYRL